MPVAGQTPTRVHYVDSESIQWTAGTAYVDPNDPTKLVRDVEAHEQELQLYAADSGAANAYAITLSPAPTIIVGTKFVIKSANANTGASTLVVNGAAAVAIVKPVSTALSGGEILAGQIFEVTYDGTNYQLSGPPTPGGANHSTQINSSGSFAGVGPGTAGQYLRSGGASADPAFANIAESEVTGLVSDLAGKVPATRQINTTAPLTGGGDLSVDRTLAISAFTGDSGSGGAKGAVPAPAAGDAAAGKFLKADGTWSVPPTTTLPNFADNETVTASGTSATLAHTPNPSGSLILVVDGAVLTVGASADFTISGASITFATAPRSGANTRAWYRY